MFGPPGVGKGTYAKLLSSKFHIPHISTGEIARDEISSGTPLGLAVKDLIASGQLLSDDVVTALVKERFKRGDVLRGFIMDGYPRTAPQAKSFDSYLGERGWKLDAVVNIKVDEEEIINRIVKRFTCPKCHAIYNIEYWPPKHSGKCDVCGGDLIKRSDESDTAIRKRLEVYHDVTEPVLAYYKAAGVVKDMSGTGGGVEENFGKLLQLLEK
jgi:adenylate kinase